MKLKNLFIFSLFFFVFLAGSSLVSAQTSVPQTVQTSLTTPATGTSLTQKALSEIDRRIAALTNSATSVANMAAISPEIKTELTTQIQAEIENLNKLKAQIQAETNAIAVTGLIASVTSSYKVYALFTPKVMILATGGKLLSLAEMLTAVQQNLMMQVTAMSSSGQDTTELEAMLTDAQENITAGTESAQSAMETVITLSPAQYPANRTSLQSARVDLGESLASLQAAHVSLGEVVTALSQTSQTVTQTTDMPTTSGAPVAPQTMPEEGTMTPL